ncbi:MAG TPA: Ig-like domain-containing protein, partial [Candidatus Acidoferrum sp.]|nr:Ig-like domain-containing protein [Candidatus Acidoferrum sp.]
MLLAFATTSAQAASLEWNPNSETNLAGYRVYTGEATRGYTSVVDVGNTTQFPLNSLTPRKTFFFAVTAYDTDGLESDFSDEVTYAVPGTNLPPVSVGETYSMAKNTVLQINAASGLLANDSDSDGDALSAILVLSPMNGVVTLNGAGGFSYTPAANFFGQDSFTYRASDGLAVSAVAMVVIVVSNTPTPPTNRTPIALNDQYVTGKNTRLFTDDLDGALVNDSDPDGNALTAFLVSPPAHGQVSMDVFGGFSYLPTTNFVGTDSFNYRVTDGAATSSVATVTISVTNIVPVNRAPMATDEQYAMEKNKLLTVTMGFGVLVNDFDPDGNAITAVVVSAPTQGQLSVDPAGSFAYMPATNFVGTQSFTYRAFDGSMTSAIATVTITVTNGPANTNTVPVNRAPFAANEQYATAKNTPLNVSATFGVLANDSDPDGDAVVPLLVLSPVHGSLTIYNSGEFSYRPTSGYVGADSFTYRAFDGTLTSAVATVSIIVTNTTPVENRAPLAANDSYAVVRGQALTIDAGLGLLTNDSDPDGNPLTATVAAWPSHGTLTMNSVGGFVYAPAPDFVGEDIFQYRAS